MASITETLVSEFVMRHCLRSVRASARLKGEKNLPLKKLNCLNEVSFEFLGKFFLE